MFKNPGTKWPIIIALAIAGVVGMSVVTLKVASKYPVEMESFEMHSYHDYDHGVNEIIEAKIAFDKKYTLSFITPQLAEKGAVVAYKVTDKSGNAVNNATVQVVLSRPDCSTYDLNLSNPTVNEGTYTFSPIDLPKAGRWNIVAKFSVDKDARYFSLKADTRSPNTLEY